MDKKKLKQAIKEEVRKVLNENEEILNKILDKISAKGKNSLTQGEKEFLDKHSKGNDTSKIDLHKGRNNSSLLNFMNQNKQWFIDNKNKFFGTYLDGHEKDINIKELKFKLDKKGEVKLYLENGGEDDAWIFRLPEDVDKNFIGFAVGSKPKIININGKKISYIDAAYEDEDHYDEDNLGFGKGMDLDKELDD